MARDLSRFVTVPLQPKKRYDLGPPASVRPSVLFVPDRMHAARVESVLRSPCPSGPGPTCACSACSCAIVAALELYTAADRSIFYHHVVFSRFGAVKAPGPDGFTIFAALDAKFFERALTEFASDELEVRWQRTLEAA